MNLQTCQDKTIQLINQYSVNGNLITTKNNDYYLRFANLADAAQKEIATVRKISNVFKFSQNQVPNLISQSTALQVTQHTNQDLIFQGLGAKAYYFECDGTATVTIEVNGTIQTTINCNASGVFTSYSGFITANANDSVVLRFSGQYVYSVWNIALYAYTFPNTASIPPYRTYSTYALPSDLMQLRDIMIETSPFDYVQVTDYRVETKNLKINSFLSGNIIVNYYKYPTDITPTTAMTYNFEVEADAQELIPYYIAAHIYMEDNPMVATTLLNEYQLKLSKLKDIDPISQQVIQDVWGWF